MGMLPMGEVWLYLYKHICTRKYLNLDGAGRTYAFKDGKYFPADINKVLEEVFT